MKTLEEILQIPEAEISAMNDPLMKELVPGSGKCATLEGEYLRAINRIGYRFYNDGDILHQGYGIETCGSAWIFLNNQDRLYNFIHQDLRSEFMELVEDLKTGTDQDYESSFLCLIDVIIRQILIGKLNGMTPNTEDILDYYKEAVAEFGDPNNYEEEEDEDDSEDYTL